jgi:hypothetical protein
MERAGTRDIEGSEPDWRRWWCIHRNPMNLPKTKYARSDDVRIAYQITGDGPFDVIWAPGTMSHLDLDWEVPQRALFFERFSRFCRLIRRSSHALEIWPNFSPTLADLKF